MARKKILPKGMNLSLRQLYKLYPDYKQYRTERKNKSKYNFIDWVKR